MLVQPRAVRRLALILRPSSLLRITVVSVDRRSDTEAALGLTFEAISARIP